MQLNPNFDPYETTYIGDYQWPGEIQEQRERRERVEQGVGTQCATEGFSVNYNVIAGRTTVGRFQKGDIFEMTTPPIPVPMRGYPAGKKYVKLRFGRPRPKRIRADAVRQEAAGYSGDYDANIVMGAPVVSVTEDLPNAEPYNYSQPVQHPPCNVPDCCRCAQVQVISA